MRKLIEERICDIWNLDESDRGLVILLCMDFKDESDERLLQNFKDGIRSKWEVIENCSDRALLMIYELSLKKYLTS